MEKDLILITGAILTSDNTFTDKYNKIISWFDKDKFEILTPLDTMKFIGSDTEKYERAMKLVRNSKVIVAEMSSISTGQGMELQEASSLNIPVLVVAKNGSKISSLVKGCRVVKKIIYYENIDDIKDSVLEFIKQYMVKEV